MDTDQERWHCNECGHDFIRGDASSVEVGDSLEHVIACPVCLANEWDTPGALTMIEEPEADEPIKPKPVAITIADEVDRFPQAEMLRLERADMSAMPENTPQRQFQRAYYNDPTVNTMVKQGASKEAIIVALVDDKARLLNRLIELENERTPRFIVPAPGNS